MPEINSFSKLIFIFILFCSFNANAQFTSIPDNAFEQYLIDNGFDTGALDNQVLTANISSVTDIMFDVFSYPVTDLTGIEDFTALEKLNCGGNIISTVDLSSNINLTHLTIDTDLSSINLDNNINLSYLILSGSILTLDIALNTNLDSLHYSSQVISSPDITNNVNLVYLYIAGTYFPTIDLSNNVLLEKIVANDTELSTIDVSNCIALEYLTINNNYILSEVDLSNNPNLLYFYSLNCSNLTYINLKNGNNVAINDLFILDNIDISLSVLLMCLDDVNSGLAQNIITQVGPLITFSEYCSLTPAQSNIISGNVKIDANNNGCDISDDNFEAMYMVASDGVNQFSTFTDSDGNYLLYVGIGNYTVSTNTSLSYYTPVQNNQNANFTTTGNTVVLDYCLSPTPNINDLSITFVAVSGAAPGGFFTKKIKYSNRGTTTLSGEVELFYDGLKLSFISASEPFSSQTSNSYKVNFTSIAPNESRVISYDFTVLTPPNANIGDVLKFSGIVTPIINDSTPDDNIIDDGSITIGPFDPNDITVLEGPQVEVENISRYLNYAIRFQNTGNAPAINVVVETELDPNLDWNTLQFIHSSHSSVTSIENGSSVQFIFENINLIDSTNDEPNSHGYLSYRIKPISSIQVGDDIDATAHIFFDFNEAVVTNTANTIIIDNLLRIENNDFNDFIFYPNPSSDVVSFSSSKEIKQVVFYNSLGVLVMKTTLLHNVNISHLSKGIYFCNVTFKKGKSEIVKFIKL